VSKKDLIVQEAQKVISTYTQKLTLRQIYYRLVAKLIIENKTSQYKYLSRLLVDARKSGLIRYDAMEDRTREVINNKKVEYASWRVNLKRWITYISNPRYTLPKNLYQEKISLIVLEKQALEGIFKDAINDNSILIVCKGYNSLTQIYDLSTILENDNREVHCTFFSDYDPSGLDIQRNFLKQCEDLGVEFESFNRIALIKEQIDKYHLPYAPTKTTDSRSKDWKNRGVVELDALDPNILVDLVKKACSKNWDKNIEKQKNRLKKVLNQRYRKHFAKELIKLAKKLEKKGV